MTHIPVGKKLPVTEYVPLPQNRPKQAEIPPVQDMEASIDPTMPLGLTEKPADAFKSSGGYHPSSLDQIDLLSLPRASEYNLTGTTWMKYIWNEYNPFNFSWSEDKHGWYNLNIYNNASEVFLWLGSLVLVGLGLSLLVLGVEKILEKLDIISKDR